MSFARVCTIVLLATLSLGGCGDDAPAQRHDAGVDDAVAIDADPTPIAPIITGTSPATSVAVPSRNRLPIVSGMTTAGASIAIYTDACTGTPVGTGSADASGAFAVILTAPVAADGTVKLFAEARANGHTSPCSAMAYSYFTDNTAPATPQITGTMPMTTATMPSRLTMPTVTGTGEPGAAITISTQSDCSAPIATGSAGGTGAFALIVSAVAADGTTALYASATDAAGNVSGCSTLAVSYFTDNTPPAAPAITSSVPTTSASTPAFNLLPSLSGTAEGNTAVAIYTGAGCIGGASGSTTATAAGTFTVTVTSGVNPNGPTPLYARATDYAGNASCAPTAFIYYTDTTGPRVTTVSSTNPNGYYNNPDVISVQVLFSEPVLVMGTPRLQLAVGNPAHAIYKAGSATNTLTFEYVVADGDSSSDLDYSSTTALQLDGGAITDSALNAVVLTLPLPSSSGSLSQMKDIQIDTQEPYIQDLDITPVVVSPTPPVNLGMSLEWYAGDDRTFYFDLDFQLCRGTTPSACMTSFTNTSTIPTGALTYVDENVPQNQRYWYVLRVLDRAGNFTDYWKSYADDANQPARAGVYAKSLSEHATVEIVSGRAHTCALTGRGRIYCWGDNTYGQLGVGYLGNSPAVTFPHEAGVLTARQIVAGDNHTCAMTEFGVYCWGDNQYGQLGLGDFMPRTSPTRVQSVSAISIVAGSNHTCAVTGGTPYCWGRNQAAQLGDGSITNRPSPVEVVGGPAGNRVLDVAAGDDFTCILERDGSISCIGDNTAGQLGSNGVTPLPGSSEKVQLAAGQAAMAIGAGGQHACALLTDRSLWCWGRGTSGELGDGGNANQPAPTQAGTTLFASLPHRIGATTTCAIGVDRRPYCWGANAAGNVGGGAADPQRTPFNPTASNMIAIAAGTDHTCAVETDGQVQCWGSNAAGQRGDNLATAGATIAPVLGPYDVAVPKQVVTGYYHTCALETDGNVMCWGENSSGQLGTTTVATRTNYPTPTIGSSGAISHLAANGLHTCVIGAEGKARCWGINNHGQLGNNSVQTAATMVDVFVDQASTPLTGVTELSLGADFSCALAGAGQPYCWGTNTSLVQGGSNTAADQLVAAPVGDRDGQAASFASTLQVVAGGQHACLVHGESTRYAQLSCWGESDAFQLGINATSDLPYPSTSTFVLSDVRDASCGLSHSCAISGTTASCWGSDSAGQLGNGVATGDKFAPQSLNLTGGGYAIRAGYNGTCVFGIYASCWGENSMGELGLGTTTDAETPQGYSVPPLLRDARPNGRHTCFLTDDGAVLCSGFNGANTTTAPGAGELGTTLWQNSSTSHLVRWL